MNERSPCDKGGRIPGPLVTGGLEREAQGAPMGSALAQVQGSTPKGSSEQQELERQEGTGVSLKFPAEAEPGSGRVPHSERPEHHCWPRGTAQIGRKWQPFPGAPQKAL